MNIKQIILAVTVLSAASAVFAEAPYPAETTFVSTKTMTEVAAEVTQAQTLKLSQKRGSVKFNDLYAGH